MISHLRVKIKSLAAESVIIKKEEIRHKKHPEIRASLANHRKTVVRTESRLSFLAYGFLKGKSYKDVENTCKKEPDWVRVRNMVVKFGQYGLNYTQREEQLKQFDIWVKKAKEGLQQ